MACFSLQLSAPSVLGLIGNKAKCISFLFVVLGFIHYKKYMKMFASAWKEELDLFTKPLIIRGHREIHISEETQIQRKKDYQSISVEQLLSDDDHRFLILQGESGLGKSCTLKWIMQEWASGTLHSDRFDLVFLLKCDELALSSQAILYSLLDLVNDDATYRDLIQNTLLASPHRILFLIDGFNESGISEEDIKSSPAGPFTKVPTKSIFSGLLSGRILPESLLLVTTTPSAADRLNNLFKDRPKRFAEILGFTEDGVEDYFRKFFDNNTDTFQAIKANKILFTSCLKPVLSRLICRCIRDTQKEVQVGTITDIFLNYLTLFQPCWQGNNKKNLSQLCDQAKRVMWEGKNQFEWGSPKFLEGTGILTCINNSQPKKMHRFTHQSFEEFFAALHYAILHNKESQREEVEELLLSQNDFLHSKLHLQPVLKFLFGLSNKAVRTHLQNTLEIPDSSSSSNQDAFSIQNQLKEWIWARKDTFSTNESVLFLFHCLHELHEEQFAKEVMQFLRSFSFSYIPLTHSDCLVIQYCLKAHPSIKDLDLRHCNLSAEKLMLLEPVWANLQYEKLW